MKVLNYPKTSQFENKDSRYLKDIKKQNTKSAPNVFYRIIDKI